MSWQNAPLLNQLTATQLGGERGRPTLGRRQEGHAPHNLPTVTGRQLE